MLKKHRVLIIVIVMTLVVMISYSSILNINTAQTSINNQKNGVGNKNEEMDIDDMKNVENEKLDPEILRKQKRERGQNGGTVFDADNIQVGLPDNNNNDNFFGNEDDIPIQTTLKKTDDKLLIECLVRASKQNNQLSIEKTKENWFSYMKTITSEKKEKCHYSNQRDYDKQPVRVVRQLTDFQENVECQLPCSSVHQGGPYTDSSIHSISSCEKSMYETLENVKPYGRKYDIVATTDTKSDVPLGYYSWKEYPYFKKPIKKIHNKEQGLVAAFISNCSPQFRLDYMNRLIAAGIKVDSYGHCNHNKQQRQTKAQDYNGAKMEISSSYKFVMSFENSETDDYVTEKLFGVFTIGSVPIYHGAPNGKKFFPSPNAGIFVNDFKSPEDLAAHLKFLDENDDEYEKCLQWKKTGPTKDWMVVMDQLKANGDCRTCIKVADLQRKEVGMVVNKNASMQLVPKSFTPNDGIVVFIRERNTFWFTSVAIPYSTTYVELVEIFSTALDHKGEIYSANDLWTKDPIIDFKMKDKTIKLTQNQEIEVLFADLDFFWHSKKLPPGEE
ncbi:hypothetical protein ACTFIY_011852 [Dictyostelium cf. discoideum]